MFLETPVVCGKCRIGQRKKSLHDAVTGEASADPSGAQDLVALQRCLTLKQEGPAFIPHQALTGSDRCITLALWSQASPGEASAVSCLRIQCSRSWRKEGDSLDKGSGQDTWHPVWAVFSFKMVYVDRLYYL